MVHLSLKIKDELIADAKKYAPQEACGILSGKEGRIEKFFPVANTDQSGQTFFMDPKEQLRVMKEIRNSGQEFLGIYHSHLKSDAYPSQHDVDLAFYPEVSYVIVSIKDNANPTVRSFKILDAKISEEEVVVD